MSILSEAFASVFEDNTASISESELNPQVYDYLASSFVSPTPKRHILGLIGGNDVSLTAGNMVDLESDIKGINIPITRCPQRQYRSPTQSSQQTSINTISRNNTKIKLNIDTTPVHLPSYQMWGYPAVHAPLPIKNEVCKNPEKY